MIKYKCPVCGLTLENDGKSFVCGSAGRHTFDVAKEGYVNFAVGGKSESGDSAEMCASRRRFLSKGYYEKFARLLCESVKKYISPEPEAVIDAGCGEGYYLRAMRSFFPESRLFGVDLAKNAIKLASKSEKQTAGKKNEYSVCGIFSLPFFDNSFDAAISVFAPVGAEESLRVLKKDGFLFVAGPGKSHLSGLKRHLYDNPYDNEEKIRRYDGFKYVGKEFTEYTVTVKKDDIFDLFTMTPYYWKTSRGDSEKLRNLAELKTELSFEISVYRAVK